ncbi:glutathione S-transferase family protein [Celerinatantimonas yamalensis]|uniref:Glutathione S-transferase family protein n=1 Tax=Celerinatantimonas yamalensis TaxID=559956 RepID=A0ABW9G7F3_9GAMM
MKLFSTPNSPFSRIARIAIHELSLTEKIDIEFVTVRDQESELLKYGPLGKVPALQVDGELFSDSRIIVNKLESLAESVKLTARSNDSASLSFEGFCIGFLESISIWVREARRKQELISQELLEVERSRAIRCVKYLSQNMEHLRNSISLASIAVACALDLAQRRLSFNEFEKYPELNDWLQEISKRKSFRCTEPLPI